MNAFRRESQNEICADTIKRIGAPVTNCNGSPASGRLRIGAIFKSVNGLMFVSIVLLWVLKATGNW